MLHHGITGACNEDVVELAKAALGTAGARVLDLQNIGTPVGQHSSRGGNERPVRDLEYAHASHRSAH
jgi:hypothetical protein